MISKQSSFYLLIATFLSVIIFHLLVIAGVIPFSVVWGGRLNNANEMLRFEIASIIINLVMIAIVLLYRKAPINSRTFIATRILIWIMAVLFALNTIGNLLSNSQAERLIFTPVTALLCLVV